MCFLLILFLSSFFSLRQTQLNRNNARTSRNRVCCIIQKKISKIELFSLLLSLQPQTIKPNAQPMFDWWWCQMMCRICTKMYQYVMSQKFLFIILEMRSVNCTHEKNIYKLRLLVLCVCVSISICFVLFAKFSWPVSLTPHQMAPTFVYPNTRCICV